jgi:hypothetical protein
MSKRILGTTLLAASAMFSLLFAATGDFVPDLVFRASSLNSLRTMGQADWRASNGEITGKPQSQEGGWLLFDKSYQDVQFHTEFRCATPCNAGVLLRAEKTADGGLKGVYVSLNEGAIGTYDLTLSAEGTELSRKPLLRSSAGFARMAVGPPVDAYKVPGYAALAPTLEEQKAEEANPSASGARPGGGRRGPPPPSIRAGDWNELDLIVDTDLVTVSLNGRRMGNAATNDHMMGYGPIALHVAGPGEVVFKDLSFKDLNSKTEPAEKVSEHFRMQRLNDFFYSWGATAGDVTRDGVPDVVAGPFYFVGPDYTERREFTAGRTYNPSNNFPDGHVFYVNDFTGDGWNDIVAVHSRPIYLFVNPQGEGRRWDRYNVVPDAMSEIEVFGDIDGDGKPEVVFTGPGATMAYAKPDPANPTAPWKVHTISEKGLGSAHGMGIGDINGDGRMDVVNSRGWWEQPATGAGDSLWDYHAAEFGRGGAEMGVFDVNGDGRSDVVTSLAAHGWGLAWFEQKRDPQGNISFVQHDIMGDLSSSNAGDVAFSQIHGAAFADMDGDGVIDIIAGKRLYSHQESHLDPDPYGTAVVYWYRTMRNPKAEGGAEFVPELIHNRSGVGSQFTVTDLNGDRSPDVVISCIKGTFVFWNQM